MNHQPRILLSAIRETAKERPAGYYEDYVSRGTIQGEYLYISIEAAKEVAKMYHPGGLGSYAEKVFKPVARMIDSVAGTDLENCQECDETKKDWNKKWSPDVPPEELPSDALA